MKTIAEPVRDEAKQVIGLNSRLDEMVHTADVLYSVLQQSQAKHCEKCQFLYRVTLSSCPTCGDCMSTTIQLDALY
ncbi:hypothetical protein, partial [Arsukibacterium sp.]|uniref:hypothetical protein n=1 Tax=Arsukibacterium sp. TaxID=1977258 RepID=UPI002FD8D44D